MQTHLAALAHASVLQLREALRRVTALHPLAAPTACEPQAPCADDANVPAWAEWEETTFDIRHTHA